MSLLDTVFPEAKAAKWIAGGIVVAAIFFGIWLFYNNYNNALTKIAQNEIAMQSMREGIEKQQNTIASIQNDIKEIGVLRDQLAANDKKYEEGFRDTETKFNKINKTTGEIRDFTKLAAAKPGLVGKIINEGTIDFLRCVELASGAPRTQDEINAKIPSKINSTCPELANPNFNTIH